MVDTLFNCIQNYNKDCALRLLHPSCFEGKDIAADLRETLSWCVANVQSFGKQVKEYPIKSRVYDICRMIAMLIRDYEKQMTQDDSPDKGIWRDMGKVYQYGDEILREWGYQLPQIPNVLFRSVMIPKQPTPTPTPPPSVQATAKDDAPLPDFSHMESYTPVIPFDMSALYQFLINESVIKDIDLTLFADCITHAHINELWESHHVRKKRKRNLLQSLFKMLSDFYPGEWIENCADNLGVTKKQITNPTTSNATLSFEDGLRKVLRGKPIK